MIVKSQKKLIERSLLGVERPACRFAAGALGYRDFKCLLQSWCDDLGALAEEYNVWWDLVGKAVK